MSDDELNNAPGQKPVETHWSKRYYVLMVLQILAGLAAIIIIGTYFDLPTFMEGGVKYVTRTVRFAIKNPLRVETSRSLVHRQFVLAQDEKGTLTFKQTGPNTSYQLELTIENTEMEAVVVKSLVLSNASGSVVVCDRWNRLPLAPLQLLPVHLETDELSPEKISVLLTGSMKLTVTTNMNSFSVPVNSVCFAGETLPNGEHLFLTGSDSSSVNYELENPLGLDVQTEGFTKF